MLLDIIQGGIGSFNLMDFIKQMLLSLPAFVLALSVHEAAHGYIALKLGDPTAKLMGRVTLNPLKHLDPYGFLMLLIAGVGWAKPVPVNPRNFKNPRRDDFLVSIAGVTMNLAQFILGCALIYAFLWTAISRIPSNMILSSGEMLVTIEGQLYRLSKADAILYATGMGEYLIAPTLGTIAGYFYEILVNYAVVNLALCLFNLLPIPPLDGYHVLNDLLIKRNLYATANVARIGQGVVMLLAITGLLGKGLNFLITGAFSGVGQFVLSLLGGAGV